MEVAAALILMPDSTSGAAYTWLERQTPTGCEEIRRPEHTARLDVNYAFDTGRGNINVAGDL